jgi:hypothetical protein
MSKDALSYIREFGLELNKVGSEEGARLKWGGDNASKLVKSGLDKDLLDKLVYAAKVADVSVNQILNDGDENDPEYISKEKWDLRNEVDGFYKYVSQELHRNNEVFEWCKGEILLVATQAHIGKSKYSEKELETLAERSEIINNNQTVKFLSAPSRGGDKFIDLINR